MSLTISVSIKSTANFIIPIDDVELATDENPLAYREIFDSIVDNDAFYTDYVLPAFGNDLKSPDAHAEIEIIGDEMGSFDVHLDDLKWTHFVDQQLIDELYADELREQIKEAVDCGDFEKAKALIERLEEMEG